MGNFYLQTNTNNEMKPYDSSDFYTISANLYQDIEKKIESEIDVKIVTIFQKFEEYDSKFKAKFKKKLKKHYSKASRDTAPRKCNVFNAA